MQLRAAICTKSNNIACVRRNFRFQKDNVHKSATESQSTPRFVTPNLCDLCVSVTNKKLSRAPIPSPVPSSSLPPLQSPVSSGPPTGPSPSNSPAAGFGPPGVSQTGQGPPSPASNPSGFDPAFGAAAGTYAGSLGTKPSPLAARTDPAGVCPILGNGGNGCQGLPPWLIQQLAETGYGGVVVLLAGVILCLAGIAGLTRRRRRRQALP